MQTENVAIRAARLDDALEIARLACELGYATTAEAMGRRLRRVLSDSNHYVAVAAIGTPRLLGWMHVEHRLALHSDERAEIVGLVVDAAQRRRGIGRALLDAAESWACARGAQRLVVRSNTVRQLSHPFYESRGFERTKTQHVYVKPLPPRGASK